MAIGTISNGESGLSSRNKINALITLQDNKSSVVEVTSKSDLPTPSLGIISLASDTTYIFYGDIDLNGDRLVTTGVTCILGTSSETSSLTSTGLTGNAILTSEWTLPMRHITFKDAEIGVSLGSSARSIAADWFGVNFLNCDIGTDIGDIDNFVFNTGAYLEGSTASFSGTAGSIVYNDSIFVSDGTAKNSIEITSTAEITRRFRGTYCAFVTFGSSTSISFDASAVVPNEAYILDTCNFSGGATYLSGVDHTSNKTLFVNNVGVENSADTSQYYMNGNSTATVISTTGTPVKVAGTTTSSAVTSKFTNTDNRATYVGALTRYFKVVVTLSATSGNNNQVGVYIAKNGVVLDESEVYGTTSGSGRAENIVCQTLVQLTNGDYLEVWVENNAGTNNVTVTDLNLVVE